MSIEPLEDRKLLSAAPGTFYVANAFYDQTTGATTSAPNAGDTVNWLASGQFAEVDGLTFGTSAFASVRSAVTAAPSGGTVDVAAGTYTENVDITSPLSLVGAGAQSVIQAPSTLGTGITINTSTGTTSIAGLTISGFQTGVSVATGNSAILTGDTVTGCMLGPGISNNGVTTLSESSVTNNLGGSAGAGGGILNGGTMTVTASTVSGNFANLGGGIYNFGTLTVRDSTIANNSASDDGAGIENSPGRTLTVENSTVSANSVRFGVGGGLDNRGAAYVSNTIIAGNSFTGTNASDPDVSGVFTSTDHDLIGVVGDATGFATTGLTASVILNSDSATAVGLSPLADNGGPTQTMALLAGSPAIDNGNASPPSPFTVPATDQRGQPRTFNGTLDVGAYETAPATLYVATSFYDQTTGTTTSSPNVGDAVNWLASGQFAEVDGLTFGTNAFTSIQSAVNALGRTIDVATGTYTENVDITRPLSIIGAGAQSVIQAPSILGTGITINTTAGTTSIADLTISGFQTGISVAATSSAMITGDTVTGCMLGPGIWNSGIATLSDSSVTNNLGGSSGAGGGILNGGTMTVTASTISGNFANLGGGIYNFGTLTVSDSTIANNSASDDGAGIENSPGRTLTVENSTVSANSVWFGLGGGLDNRGATYVSNTIIAGNSFTGPNASDPDISGVFTSTDHDLIGVVGDATGFTTTGPTASIILKSDIATDIGLAPLADNGGPTQTMALLAGSPAIDAGDDTPPAPFSVPTVDQRGVTRVTALDATVDIGAYEVARLVTTGQNVAAVEGTAFGPVTVATFTDPEPNVAASKFTATIAWGDGQSSTGTVTGSSANGFAVSGSHVYAEEGSFTISVAIHDPSTSATATSTANVSDPAVNATSVAISATKGVMATVAVATFTDPGGAEPTSDYSAKIVWGDGQTSAGVISEANGVFTVTGTNTYAGSGTLTASVTISHDSAPPVTVQDVATVSVLPAATSFVVEKGLAERSYIRYLDVTFNTPVAGLTLDPAHVKLEHFALDGVTLLGDIGLANKISLIDKVMEIDFGAGGIGGQENLPALLANWTRLVADDGYYKLVIDADGTGLHDIDLDFYRLFGDVIGNPVRGAATTGGAISSDLTYGVPTVIGQVTTGDVNSISAAVGQTGSLLNDDINGAGSVAPNDRLLAARSVGRQLAAGLHVDD
ncbi:MAG TPA: choice-of-anchor Q domain-containing protein [Pirellulales bacterium]|nr:choice-of-anchor Q domain-containing protein [Pirellulales bacterium]